jgi:hypothetical protein
MAQEVLTDATFYRMKKKYTQHTDTLFLLLLLALTFALYWPALRVFFSLDDLQFLSRAAGLTEDTGGLRRLISTRVFFAASWRLFGSRPWPYHLVVLLLHAANASILYFLARRLNLKKTASYAAAILFVTTYVAFLPLHWISGIQEVSVAFFALISAYFFLGRTTVSGVASLVAACLSMLCKETSFLLLPALALVLPVSAKRRWILGSAGLVFGLAILVLSGSLTLRPAGDPYESSFGANILWNLLTYSAWLFRFWDYFPDKLPQYNAPLAGWGLMVPILICLAAWRVPRAREPIAKAVLLFVFAIMPVLPLMRHSYFYYLYVPLIPFWLLAGAYLGSISRRSLSAVILALCMLHSFVNGIRHRKAELEEGVLEDPILRYAAAAEDAVISFRAEGEIKRGDYLIVIPLNAKAIDLSEGLDGAVQGRRVSFALVKQALLGGKALRLFFPAMENIYFEDQSSYVPGWQRMHLYLAYHLGMLKSLGYGEEGRFMLARYSAQEGFYEQAERELLIMLELHPDDPALLYALGDVASRQGDTEQLNAVLERLEHIARSEDPPGVAWRALNRLKQMK